MSKRGRTLPEPWAGAYAERRASIQQRLNEFAEIPAEDYFYELAFCVLLEALRDGTADYLATDHAPHSIEDKRGHSTFPD